MAMSLVENQPSAIRNFALLWLMKYRDA